MKDVDSTEKKTEKQVPPDYDGPDEKGWAKRISELMSEEEFRSFAQFIEGADDIAFYDAVAEIDAKRHPDDYVDPDADAERKVPVGE